MHGERELRLGPQVHTAPSITTAIISALSGRPGSLRCLVFVQGNVRLLGASTLCPQPLADLCQFIMYGEEEPLALSSVLVGLFDRFATARLELGTREPARPPPVARRKYYGIYDQTLSRSSLEKLLDFDVAAVC